MREIEVRLRVKDLDALTEKLAERGCKLSAPIRQRDVVYTNKDASGNFAGAKEGDVIIRIRHMDHVAEFELISKTPPAAMLANSGESAKQPSEGVSPAILRGGCDKGIAGIGRIPEGF